MPAIRPRRFIVTVAANGLPPKRYSLVKFNEGDARFDAALQYARKHGFPGPGKASFDIRVEEPTGRNPVLWRKSL